jgi:hypothetical protein
LRNDDQLKQTVRDGAILAYRLLQWFRAGPPDRGAIEPPVMRGPTTVLTVAAAVAVLLVGVLVFLGVIAVALKVVEYGVEPIFDYVSGPIFRLIVGLLLVPGVPPALAGATVVVGLALAPKFQPRELFLSGVFAVALGFVCLWQLPRLMAALPTPEARVQLEGPLLIVGLVISAFFLVGGFGAMGHCQWVREQDDSDETE